MVRLQRYWNFNTASGVNLKCTHFQWSKNKRGSTSKSMKNKEVFNILQYDLDSSS